MQYPYLWHALHQMGARPGSYTLTDDVLADCDPDECAAAEAYLATLTEEDRVTFAQGDPEGELADAPGKHEAGVLLDLIWDAEFERHG